MSRKEKIQTCQEEKNRKTLIIGLDGTRGDILHHVMFDPNSVAHAPNLSKLARQGAFAPCESVTDTSCARTHDGHRFGSRPSSTLSNYSSPFKWVTAVGWISTLTGSNNFHHLIKGNDLAYQQIYTNHTSKQYPTFMKYGKDAGLRTAASGCPNFITAQGPQWGIIDFECSSRPNYDANNTCNLNYRYPHIEDTPGRDERTTYFTKNMIDQDLVDIVFAHFDEIDEAGHVDGWDSIAQQREIEVTDGRIGSIMESVFDAVTNRNQSYLVMVTADHGGQSYDHGSSFNYDEAIPFIVAAYEPNSERSIQPRIIQMNLLEQPVRHFDVMPTVLSWMGLEKTNSALIDGRVQGLPKEIWCIDNHLSFPLDDY